jgi:hypothetical protein
LSQIVDRLTVLETQQQALPPPPPHPRLPDDAVFDEEGNYDEAATRDLRLRHRLHQNTEGMPHRQHRPRATFGASSASRTHTPASSHTPSTPAAHVGNLPLQVPAKKQNSPAPAAPSSGRSSGIVCHSCNGIGHVKKDCPSQRTYIATDDGYISASDGEGDEDDSNDVAANDDAILGADATVNLRSIMV